MSNKERRLQLLCLPFPSRTLARSCNSRAEILNFDNTDVRMGELLPRRCLVRHPATCIAESRARCMRLANKDAASSPERVAFGRRPRLRPDVMSALTSNKLLARSSLGGVVILLSLRPGNGSSLSLLAPPLFSFRLRNTLLWVQTVRSPLQFWCRFISICQV